MCRVGCRRRKRVEIGTPAVCLHMKEKFPSPRLLYNHDGQAEPHPVEFDGECPIFVSMEHHFSASTK